MESISSLIKERLEAAPTKPTRKRKEDEEPAAEKLTAVQRKKVRDTFLEDLYLRARALYKFNLLHGPKNYTVYDAAMAAQRQAGISVEPTRTAKLGRVLHRDPVSYQQALAVGA